MIPSECDRHDSPSLERARQLVTKAMMTTYVWSERKCCTEATWHTQIPLSYRFGRSPITSTVE